MKCLSLSLPSKLSQNSLIMKKLKQYFGVLIIILLVTDYLFAQKSTQQFKVIAFYTAKNDKAHISFVHEANKWFSKMAQQHKFVYDSTDNWANLNKTFLTSYQVVLFLDTRPEEMAQLAAFQKYMEKKQKILISGGGRG